MDINIGKDVQMLVLIGMMMISCLLWNQYFQQGVEGSLVLRHAL